MENKIDFYRSESQLMNDATDRLVVEVYKQKKENGDKTLLLTGASQQVGTTTNAINLSIALSVAGWKTVLIDTDMRKGNSSKRLNEETGRGLSDYLNESVTYEEIQYQTSYENLTYIPCGSVSDSPVRLLCTKKMETIIEELKKDFDFVVFDFPSINIVPDAEILFSIVDEIMLVAAIGKTTKRQLFDARRKVNVCHEKYRGTIVNQVDMTEYRRYFKGYDYFEGEKSKGEEKHEN